MVKAIREILHKPGLKDSRKLLKILPSYNGRRTPAGGESLAQSCQIVLE